MTSDHTSTSSTATTTSASGGSMVLLDGPAPATPAPPASVLASFHDPHPGHGGADDSLVAHGESRPWEPGTVIAWWYGQGCALLRVVADDADGLVAWMPTGSESLYRLPVDGTGLRDRGLVERFMVERRAAVRPWQGRGVLRALPRGKPWSVWYFTDTDAPDGFAGHYVNLEAPHLRPADGSARTHSRDLVLDLWLDGDGLWLKDADELEATVPAGHFTAAQADAVRALGDQARRELLEPRAWPFSDPAWEAWRAAERLPAAWQEPLRFDDPGVRQGLDEVTLRAADAARGW
ncbi:DUF402 domain-containing protein [Nocardioides bruguierae]|uniref:DUF402 domain-containing protein n=1 Tax=Nocardioides bruguierae TaxID=2945102 RepID=UPI00201FBAF1|nr:DUF402 domain-containing protein [Nocardioides bruguierae]MCL8025934.1 DUF402 domain-containing protein [Nocardioides bruguierae]